MQVTSGLICLILSLGAHAAVQPTAWDFENGSQGWKPRAATVKLELVTGPGATTSGRAYLRVHGSVDVFRCRQEAGL
jgi:hypothetical protein